MQFLIEDIQSMQFCYMYYLIIIAHLLQSKECISEFLKNAFFYRITIQFTLLVAMFWIGILARNAVKS